ncbi:MAG TPA: Fe-S cluster assembly ATPase SufC [Acidimicrobiia bacterium]|nr:Fe-S cluster assembly ATPase SufC [Acidimicrobiia bacterium]
MNGLTVRDLTASVGSTPILNGFDIDVPLGEIHAIMGPNGSGKSTLCHVLTGHPVYTVAGSARLDDVELLDKPIDERSRLGLLHGFQYPVEIPGVRLNELVREAAHERGITDDAFEDRLAAAAEEFDMTRFLDRAVNDDLSGGEKKRSEIFQMSVLDPRIVLLDEIDSGLDIDAVKQVSEAVEAMRSPEVGILMITHYSRILKYLTPDRVHVMIKGRIVESGGPELADELEDGGYDAIRSRLGIETETKAPQKRPADFFTETPFD